MNTKLTIQLDGTVIERAKQYAQENKVSLSKIIESYLRSILKADIKEQELKSPLVDELAGILTLPEDYDYKEDYTNYLIDKYK